MLVEYSIDMSSNGMSVVWRHDHYESNNKNYDIVCVYLHLCVCVCVCSSWYYQA